MIIIERNQGAADPHCKVHSQAYGWMAESEPFIRSFLEEPLTPPGSWMNKVY